MKPNKLFLATIFSSCLILSSCNLISNKANNDKDAKQSDNSELSSNDTNGGQSINTKPNEVSKEQWTKLINNLEFVDIYGNFSYKYTWEDDQADEYEHLWVDNGKMKYDGHGNEIIEIVKQNDDVQLKGYEYDEDEDKWYYEIIDTEDVNEYINFHNKDFYDAFYLYLTNLYFEDFTYDETSKSYKSQTGLYIDRFENTVSLSNIEIKFENNKLMSFSYRDEYAPFRAEFYDYGATHIAIPEAELYEAHKYEVHLVGNSYIVKSIEEYEEVKDIDLGGYRIGDLLDYYIGSIVEFKSDGTFTWTIENFMATGSQTIAYGTYTEGILNGSYTQLGTIQGGVDNTMPEEMQTTLPIQIVDMTHIVIVSWFGSGSSSGITDATYVHINCELVTE